MSTFRIRVDAGTVVVEYRSEYRPGESWPALPVITTGPLCTLNGEPCSVERAFELLTPKLGAAQTGLVLNRRAANAGT